MTDEIMDVLEGRKGGGGVRETGVGGLWMAVEERDLGFQKEWGPVPTPTSPTK